jgi:hypothetical protein
MATISWLRSEARSISNSTSAPPDIKKLARIIEQLCSKCDEIEKQAKDAMLEAERAKREARR